MENKAKNKWLVTPPDKQSYRDFLKTACRGDRLAACILDYFLYDSYLKVDREKLDRNTIPCVELKRSQDDIIAGVKKQTNEDISKKTLIAKMSKLQNYNFIFSDGYHHLYQVHFNNVNACKENTPDIEPKKPRGRHAPKLEKNTPSISQKVKSSICTFESLDIPENDEKLKVQIVNLSDQIVKVQFEIELLRNQIVNLSDQIVKVQFDNSSKDARIADLEAKFESLYKLYNLNTTSNINSLTNSAVDTDATKEDEKKSSAKILSLPEKKTSQKPTTKKTKDLTPPLDLPDLQQEPTQALIHQIGDYVRGYKLPQARMNRANEAVEALFQQKYSLKAIADVLAFMSSKDHAREKLGMKFRDENYIGKYAEADLHNIIDKMEQKIKIIAGLRKAINEDNTSDKNEMDTKMYYVTQNHKFYVPVEEWAYLAEKVHRPLNSMRSYIDSHDDGFFWTTTGNPDTYNSPDLEVLQTWRSMSLSEAVKYGFRGRPTHKLYTMNERMNVSSRITQIQNKREQLASIPTA